MEKEKIENDLAMLFMKLNDIEQKLDKVLATREGQSTLNPPTPQPKTEEKQMYPAVCHLCGVSCTVPFKPGINAKIKCISCYRESQVK